MGARDRVYLTHGKFASPAISIIGSGRAGVYAEKIFFQNLSPARVYANAWPLPSKNTGTTVAEEQRSTFPRNLRYPSRRGTFRKKERDRQREREKGVIIGGREVDGEFQSGARSTRSSSSRARNPRFSRFSFTVTTRFTTARNSVL